MTATKITRPSTYLCMAVLAAISQLVTPDTAMAQQGYYAMNCSQLWYARNAIYAEKGYCFKTARAKTVFGPRCYPPYGKLTGYEQQQVSAIRTAEKAKGCR